MNPPERFSHLIQAFFSDYLVKQRDVSLQTVKAYRDTFRLLLNYLSEATGRRPDQLALNRFTRTMMNFLSVEEMHAVLKSTGDTWTGRRDHLLLLFLYNTGARVSEAIAVSVRDVQRHDFQAVELLGKGRKERMVPLWKETSRAIRNWVKSGRLTADQLLFPNRFGTAMTRTAVQQRLHLHVQTAAVERCPSLRQRHVSPHTIRHTTAMHLLQSGVTTPVIALWLGHEDPATTEAAPENRARG